MFYSSEAAHTQYKNYKLESVRILTSYNEIKEPNTSKQSHVVTVNVEISSSCMLRELLIKSCELLDQRMSLGRVDSKP